MTQHKIASCIYHITCNSYDHYISLLSSLQEKPRNLLYCCRVVWSFAWLGQRFYWSTWAFSVEICWWKSTALHRFFRKCSPDFFPADSSQQDERNPVVNAGDVHFKLPAQQPAGVCVGQKFGGRFKNKATLAGGVILCLIGTKILLEHLGVLEQAAQR